MDSQLLRERSENLVYARVNVMIVIWSYFVAKVLSYICAIDT